MPSVERILIRGVNWLGDAVMTTPALLRLRQSHPAARITLLTHSKLAGLWQGHPAIDTVATFADDEGPWSIARRLRGEKFEVALVLPNSHRSALEMWLAAIPRRVGYARPWRNWLLTELLAPASEAVAMHKRSDGEINRLIQQGSASIPPPATAHQIFHYLQLAAALGANPEPVAPQLAVPETALANFTAKFKLAADSPADSPLFGLNPFAEYGPAKRWPEERFTKAAVQIQRRTNCRWLIFGLKSDGETAARLAGKIPGAINLAGATKLDELCAALKLCRVLLTNDSGPMHVAAALGTPVVALFGSTSPELTGPGLPGDPRHRLLRVDAPCSPCFRRECPIDFRCMTGITVDSVVQTVLEAAGAFSMQ